MINTNVTGGGNVHNFQAQKSLKKNRQFYNLVHTRCSYDT
jgi:hypothetical protein